jgi:hypothetical protein
VELLVAPPMVSKNHCNYNRSSIDEFS